MTVVENRLICPSLDKTEYIAETQINPWRVIECQANVLIIEAKTKTVDVSIANQDKAINKYQKDKPDIKWLKDVRMCFPMQNHNGILVKIEHCLGTMKEEFK